MRYILIIFILAIFACKKQNVTPTPTPTSPPPVIQQDNNLLGTWVRDSSRIDGNNTVVVSPSNIIRDSIFVSLAKWQDNYYSYGIYSSGFTNDWSTNQDSLFLVQSCHYKYSVANGKLFLYLNAQSQDVKYWYRKI